MPFFRSVQRSRRGQSLLEAVVALGTLIVGISGTLALLSFGIRTNRIVADKAIATYLASEGIEIVKNIADHNVSDGDPWGTGFSNGDFEVDYASTAVVPYVGKPLLFDPTFHVYTYANGTPTSFVRRVRITFFGTDDMEVNSTVSWSTGDAQSSVNLEDHFMNWRP